jgi:hypothetical protein
MVVARKYTDSSFVIQTTANISSQRDKSESVGQIPFSLIPFTAKSIQQRDRAYIVSKIPNPYDFLFEVEKKRYPWVSITDTYSITPADRFVAMDTSTDPKTITLPNIGSVLKGFVVTIKDVGGAAATNNITIAQHAGNKIDGSASAIKLTSAHSSISLISDGGAWLTF